MKSNKNYNTKMEWKTRSSAKPKKKQWNEEKKTKQNETKREVDRF